MAGPLAVLGPFVLATNLLLLLGGEVVGDVEGLSDLLGGLALDHVGDGLTANVEERLDVEIVGCLIQESVTLRTDVRIVHLNLQE